VSLVDDEESVAALAGEVGEGSAELREETGEAESRLGLEGEEDLAVEGGDGEVGVGEADDGVEIVVERVSKGAEGGGLAGADVAGDESGETLLEGKDEACLDLLVAARREQVRAGNGLAERGRGKAVKVVESRHLNHPPVDWQNRVAKSEWDRADPGASVRVRRAGGRDSRGQSLRWGAGRDRGRRRDGRW
jgi:hypothetical protein